jgi:hypothetical protein
MWSSKTHDAVKWRIHRPYAAVRRGDQRVWLEGTTRRVRASAAIPAAASPYEFRLTSIRGGDLGSRRLADHRDHGRGIH